MKWSIPEKIIERGRKYLQEGRVLSVTPDSENKVWHAEVLGSELYFVDLDASAKEEDYCQCPYWAEHHYCKHTVAVELYLRKQGKTRQIHLAHTPTKPAFSASQMFSNGFSRLQKPPRKVAALAIAFQVESLATNPYHEELDVLGISLKIGLQESNRSYVVKNIYKFLQIYQEEKIYLVNKQHQFLLEPTAFLPEVKELLDELLGLAQTQQLLGPTGIQINGKLDKKYLLLPMEYGKDLLMKMSQTIFSLKIGQQEVNKPNFQTGRPLYFTLKKEEEQFLLQMQHDFDAMLSFYNWGVISQEIYLLTEEQKTIYLTLQQLFKRFDTPVVAYPKKELSTLFMQVLPYLRKVGRVEIDPVVQNYIQDAPLEAAFTLRKVKGKIDTQVDFIYGDIVYSTDEKYQNVPAQAPEILRDYSQEKQILKQLETLGFTKTEKNWTKSIPNGEALYRFFTKEIPLMRRLGDVRIGKKLRELYLDSRNHAPLIRVVEDGSWLDIRFDISGIDETEIDAVLHSLLYDEAFYTLKNGQVLSLESEAFQEASKALQKIRRNFFVQDGKIKISRNQGLYLQDQLADQATFSTDFQQMVHDLTHPEEFSAPLPTGLNAQLRSYQKIGYLWLKMLSHYQFGGILADEMGLGKTLQTITYLLSEKQVFGQLQALIVAPASLTYNWQQEIKRFAPELQTIVVSGSREERDVLLSLPADIRITSYASLRQDIDHYQQLPLEYLILDEAQMVKNSSTKTAQALRSLAIKHRFALSGTPIENNLEELWSLFEMIMPGFFPKKPKFKELSTQEIAKMIQPFILRRDKKNVLKELPEKLETNYYSGLTEEQKKVYLAYLRQMREEVGQMDTAAFKKNRLSILAGLTRLRQICCDPRLFMEEYQGGSGKLDQVKDLIRAAKENGRRILLFSQFTSMLSIIEAELEQLGFSSFYLRGSTPPKDRIEMVDAFNKGTKDVFLISLKAGGTGLNLTGADTVILYDLWWNPAVEEQAAGRAHRIGQRKVVEVWRMIAEGTIEERMNALQQEKRELFQKVIQGNDAQLQSMTENDIRLILSVGDEVPQQ